MKLEKFVKGALVPLIPGKLADSFSNQIMNFRGEQSKHNVPYFMSKAAGCVLDVGTLYVGINAIIKGQGVLLSTMIAVREGFYYLYPKLLDWANEEKKGDKK